jgi:hypothetical protein
MASSSGTYGFNPSLGEAVLYAFHLCGIRPPQIGQEHMFTARMAANLLQQDWSNEGVNLWEVKGPITIPFVQGVPTYAVQANAAILLDVYVTQPGSTVNTDRIITPITRTEYASYPNKLQQSTPNVYWYDRLMSPSITFWQTPNASPYTQANYYYMSIIQDAVLAGGTTLDVVNRFLPAYVYGLAAALSETWAPSATQRLQASSDARLARAKGQDVERGNIMVSPMLSGYYRN